MGGFDKFCISILDALAHGPFFNEGALWKNSGYKKFDIETKINEIKLKKININNDAELKIMLIKSLTLLTMFPHNHDDEIKKYTNFEKDKLTEFLNKLNNKNVDVNEYQNILNC